MKLRKPKYQYQDMNNPYRGNPNYITNYNYEEELEQDEQEERKQPDQLPPINYQQFFRPNTTTLKPSAKDKKKKLVNDAEFKEAVNALYDLLNELNSNQKKTTKKVKKDKKDKDTHPELDPAKQLHLKAPLSTQHDLKRGGLYRFNDELQNVTDIHNLGNLFKKDTTKEDHAGLNVPSQSLQPPMAHVLPSGLDPSSQLLTRTAPHIVLVNSKSVQDMSIQQQQYIQQLLMINQLSQMFNGNNQQKMGMIDRLLQNQSSFQNQNNAQPVSNDQLINNLRSNPQLQQLLQTMSQLSNEQILKLQQYQFQQAQHKQAQHPQYHQQIQQQQQIQQIYQQQQNTLHHKNTTNGHNANLEYVQKKLSSKMESSCKTPFKRAATHVAIAYFIHIKQYQGKDINKLDKEQIDPTYNARLLKEKKVENISPVSGHIQQQVQQQVQGSSPMTNLNNNLAYYYQHHPQNTYQPAQQVMQVEQPSAPPPDKTDEPAPKQDSPKSGSPSDPPPDPPQDKPNDQQMFQQQQHLKQLHYQQYQKQKMYMQQQSCQQQQLQQHKLYQQQQQQQIMQQQQMIQQQQLQQQKEQQMLLAQKEEDGASHQSPPRSASRQSHTSLPEEDKKADKKAKKQNNQEDSTAKDTSLKFKIKQI